MMGKEMSNREALVVMWGLIGGFFVAWFAVVVLITYLFGNAV